MRITEAGLIRAGGLAAAAAGVLFIVVQTLHPVEVLASVTTRGWAVVHALTMLMAVLGLLGVSAVYARQTRRVGWIGLLGFLLLFVWLALVFAFTFVEAFVLPLLVVDAPRFVEGVLGIFNGHPGGMDLGALALVGPLSGVLYVLGGALLGVATFRAGVLPRWAGALLVLAAFAPLVVSVLPHGWQRLAAVPMGLSLIWLGWASWGERRVGAAGSVVGDTGSEVGTTSWSA